MPVTCNSLLVDFMPTTYHNIHNTFNGKINRLLSNHSVIEISINNMQACFTHAIPRIFVSKDLWLSLQKLKNLRLQKKGQLIFCDYTGGDILKIIKLINTEILILRFF